MDNVIKLLTYLHTLHGDMAGGSTPWTEELRLAYKVLRAFQEDWDWLEQLRNEYNDRTH